MDTYYFVNNHYFSLVWLSLCFTRCQANLKKRQEHYCWFSVGRARKTVCLFYSSTLTRIGYSSFKNIKLAINIWRSKMRHTWADTKLQPNSHPCDGNCDYSTCFLQFGELFSVFIISCCLKYSQFQANEGKLVRRELRLKLGNGREPSKLARAGCNAGYKQAWGREYDASHSSSGIGQMQTPGGGVPCKSS